MPTLIQQRRKAEPHTARDQSYSFSYVDRDATTTLVELSYTYSHSFSYGASVGLRPSVLKSALPESSATSPPSAAPAYHHDHGSGDASYAYDDNAILQSYEYVSGGSGSVSGGSGSGGGSYSYSYSSSSGGRNQPSAAPNVAELSATDDDAVTSIWMQWCVRARTRARD